MVAPIGKLEPLAKPAIKAVVDPVQLSAPAGAGYVTIAPHSPGGAVAEMFAGHVIDGAMLSVTVTVNEQSVEAPFPAVTRYVTVVVPTGKVEPLEKPAISDVVEPEQLSVPIGAI